MCVSHEYGNAHFRCLVSVTQRTVSLPPLGFPILPLLTTASTTTPSVVGVATTTLSPVSTNILSFTPDQVVAAGLGSLPLWFLIGIFYNKTKRSLNAITI